MSNANKRRGDAYERRILTYAEASGFIEAFRGRAGQPLDEGDIWLDQIPGAIIQCKDVASPQWRAWLAELDEQKKNAGTDIGFLAVKRRGSGGRPPLDLAVMTVPDMLRILYELKRLKGAVD